MLNPTLENTNELLDYLNKYSTISYVYGSRVSNPPRKTGSCTFWNGSALQFLELTKGKMCLFNEEDWLELSQFRWYANYDGNNWYVKANVPGRPGKTVYMHQIITGGNGADHINGNGLDNRRCNLRPATASQNNMNTRSRGGTSDYKGVSWYKRDKKWKTYIKINYCHVHLGYFTDEWEAAMAYDKAAREYFGEFAWLNSEHFKDPRSTLTWSNV